MHIDPLPELRLTPRAHEKLDCWTDLASGEVSGLGTTTEVRDRDGRIEAIRVDNVHLLEQHCSESSTEMDSEAVARFLHEAACNDRADSVRLWWHSHADMDVFWSGTDEETVERIGGAPYFVSLVCNKAGHRRARLDLFEPFRITVDELPWNVIVPEVGVEQDCIEAFEDKVIERPAIGRLRTRNVEPEDREEFLMPETAALAGAPIPRRAGDPLETPEFDARFHDPFYCGDL